MTDYTKLDDADLVQLLLCVDFGEEPEHTPARGELMRRLGERRELIAERCSGCVCAESVKPKEVEP